MLFKASQVSYVDGKLVEVGQNFEPVPYRDPKSGKLRPHTPGPHWEPVDDEAKKLMADTKTEFTGEIPDIVNSLSERLDRMMGERQGIDHDALAAAIAKGLNDGRAPALDQAAFAGAIAAAMGPVVERAIQAALASSAATAASTGTAGTAGGGGGKDPIKV